MKILVCGNGSDSTAMAEAAVYDAGCVPIGPVGNALRALGLADQERPAAAVVDLSAMDDGNGSWLADKLCERGIDLVCLSNGKDTGRGLTLRRHVSIIGPEDRSMLTEFIETCRDKREAARSTFADYVASKPKKPAFAARP